MYTHTVAVEVAPTATVRDGVHDIFLLRFAVSIVSIRHMWVKLRESYLLYSLNYINICIIGDNGRLRLRSTISNTRQ